MGLGWRQFSNKTIKQIKKILFFAFAFRYNKFENKNMPFQLYLNGYKDIDDKFNDFIPFLTSFHHDALVKALHPEALVAKIWIRHHNQAKLILILCIKKKEWRMDFVGLVFLFINITKLIEAKLNHLARFSVINSLIGRKIVRPKCRMKDLYLYLLQNILSS